MAFTAYPAEGGDSDKTAGKKGDDAILDRIRSRHKYHISAWRDIRKDAEDDMRALSVEGPWDTAERERRKRAGRPCIHLDQLTQYTNGFMGEVRQSPIAVKVNPAGGGATEKTAELRGNRIRQIEYESNATQATLTALENAVERSYGVFGLTIDYRSWDSDELCIKFRRFANPDAVSWDPDCKQADCSDMRDAFVHDWLTFDDFKDRFGDKASITEFGAEEAAVAPDWIDREGQMVLVSEYWCIEYEKAETKGKRETKKPKVMCYLTNGVEILETNDTIPGTQVPIFPIVGKERYVPSGKKVTRKLYSLIRPAIDGQMLFDYYKTCEAEDVGLTPKPKWLGYEGQFETTSDWQNANRDTAAYLEVKPTVDAATGQVLPLPRWDSHTPNTQALSIGSEAARQAIQAAIGNYGFTRQDGAVDRSGKALRELKKNEDTVSYHLLDSYKASVQRCGQVMNEWLESVEGGEPTEVGIRTEDGQHQIVKMNQPSQDKKTGQPQLLKYSETEDARHDVTISTGPSYQSQREEASEFADTLAASNAPFVPLIMDLVIRSKNLGPLGDQMAERLTPPQFKEQDPNDPAQQQEQVAQLQQQHEQLVQAVHTLTQEIESKKYELESKERIATMQVQADLLKTSAQLDAQGNQALLNAKIAELEGQINRQHELEMHDAQHNAALEQQQQAAALQPEPTQEGGL